MEGGTSNNTLRYRVGELEKKLDKLNNKVDALLTDEIPTMREDILALKTRINVLTAVNIGAIILALLISKLITVF